MFRALIRFYQIVISPITPGNCRYYPSCSEYALIQFEKRNPFSAFAASLLRILRCNQLFEGGFDYPLIPFKPECRPLAKKDWHAFKTAYFLIPEGRGKARVIRKLKEMH